MLRAFRHREGHVKIENSTLAKANCILFVWTIHRVIIESKHLKAQKKVTVKCNVWQDNLRMEIAATDCTAQRTSMKGRWIIGLF